MADFNSKYSGEQVEALLDQVANGEIGGGIETETDPIFSASPAATITENDKAAWSSKQDAINDLATIREGATKGATAVQPEDVKDKVYIADFTMESLTRGMNNSSQVGCDIQALITAMNANKIILVREGADSSYKGVHVLNGYAEDLLYFSIVDSQGDILYCEGTDYVNYGQFIDGRTLRVRNWWDKQDTLVSGENIKTINGESIVGSGDITISGGSSGDSDIFILDLFGIAGGYPNVDDITNTGVIEFVVDSELISMIDSAIQKNKLVIRVDYVDLYNLEIDAYNSTMSLYINSYFEYMGNFVHLYMYINPSELSGTFSISTVITSSGGSIDTSNFVTSIKVDNVSKSPSSGAVDLGYINKKLTTSASAAMILSPNIYYRNTNTSLSSLTITLGSVSNSNIINEYFIEFTTSSSGTTVLLPSDIKWMNGVTPTLEASTTYQISIVNNLGTWVKFK